MDIATGISLGKSLMKVGSEIAKLIDKAQAAPDIAKRALLYLESAQAAVSALGSRTATNSQRSSTM